MPRGVVGFVFLQVLVCHITMSTCEEPPFPYGSHLPSGPASGPEKLSPCRLIGVRGRTIRRGIHGEHVGALEQALRGGSCFPRIPGSHCF